MMEFSEIWNRLTTKNPKLNNPGSTIELTSDNLQKLLKQVYEQGFASGASPIKEREERWSDWMREFFGNTLKPPNAR